MICLQILRKLFFVSCLGGAFLMVQGQHRVTAAGKVLSLPGNEPIQFANIGILNSAVGTISNPDGSFSIEIPGNHFNDSIIFSALGYGKKFIPVSAFAAKTDSTIYLMETPSFLNEVVVTGKRWARKVYRRGHRTFEGGALYLDTVSAGSAMALLIRNKNAFRGIQYEYPVYLENAQVRIVNNTFSEFKVRVRLLDKDSVGVPGKDLLNQSVVIRSAIHNGWLNVDLSPYKIMVKRDFYIVFEWILDANDRHYLYTQYQDYIKKYPNRITIDYSLIDSKRVPFVNFKSVNWGTSFGIDVSPGALKQEVCYLRWNSFGTWIRSPTILTAGVTVSTRLP